MSRTIYLFLFLAMTTTGCGNSLPQEDLTPFVIPPQDAELVYHFADGRQMYTHLLAIEKGEAELEDVIEVPKDLKLPPGLQWSDLGVSKGHTTDLYTFIIKEDRVIRRDRKSEQTLLKGPLSASASEWKTRLVNKHAEGQTERFAECQIVEIKKQRVLEKKRKTLTVDCLDQTADKRTTLLRIRFAKGLGIIEKAMYISSDPNMKIDSTPPTIHIQLKSMRPKSTEKW